MDTSLIGRFVAQFMEQIGQDWSDECTVNDMVIVVDMTAVKDGVESSQTLTACTDSRGWVQIGLLDEGIKTVEFVEREPVDE